MTTKLNDELALSNNKHDAIPQLVDALMSYQPTIFLASDLVSGVNGIDIWHSPAAMVNELLTTSRVTANPLVFTTMELDIEKEWLFDLLRSAGANLSQGTLVNALEEAVVERVMEAAETLALSRRMRVNLEAIERLTDRGQTVCGMHIGPFSLSALSINNVTLIPAILNETVRRAEDRGREPLEETRLWEQITSLGVRIIRRYSHEMIRSGARMLFIAEPSFNNVNFSPRMAAYAMERDGVYDAFIYRPLHQLIERNRQRHIPTFLHDCGDAIYDKLPVFDRLKPEFLSLGSGVDLPRAAQQLSTDIVLTGNMPSKIFRESELDIDQIIRGVMRNMALLGETGHRYIPASECEVRQATGYNAEIFFKLVECIGRVRAFHRMVVGS